MITALVVTALQPLLLDHTPTISRREFSGLGSGVFLILTVGSRLLLVKDRGPTLMTAPR